METFFLEVGIVFGLILVNGFLAMSEMALVSSKQARLMDAAKKGDWGANKALKVLSESSNFLAAIQVGITLVGVIAGTYSGATISEKIALHIDRVFPQFAQYSEAISVGFVVLSITYLSLVVGELVPKRLALNHPEKTAARVAAVISIFSVITKPLVYLLTLSTESILKILGSSKSDHPPVTEEEVKILIEQGREAGVFEKNEESMLKKVLQFPDLKAIDLMTPRTRVVCIDINDDKKLILDAIHETKHTYFPVYDGEVDNLVGLLSAKLVLSDVLSAKTFDFDVRKCVIPDPLFVPGSIRADVVLEKFRSSKKHMAIVVDEFGGMAGVISIIDLMESIVGDVPDDNTAGPENAVRRADGSWLIEGNLAIDDAAELTGINALNNYIDSDASTIAGLIMEQTGHIPKEGERLELPGVILEVLDMDGNRIDKVLIQESTLET